MEPPPRKRVSICHRDQDGGHGRGRAGAVTEDLGRRKEGRKSGSRQHAAAALLSMSNTPTDAKEML